jgi:uncharacterized protein YbjT (DUF2867 family)
MRCLLRERRAVVFVANCAPVTEEAVRESGLGWTFLRPNSFMSNTFRWIAQARSGDVVRLPFASVRIAAIDPDDLAAVARGRSPLARPRGARVPPERRGSAAPGEQVRIVAEVLGRELRLEAQSNEDARAEMSTRMPAEYVEAFSFFVDGELDESQILPTVEEITGRMPRTFAQWARANAEALI